MFNKITKIIMTICLVALFVDFSHALKLPGGLGGKKSKKAAKAAVAYNLVAPEYDPGLAAFGVIGAYDLGIAGAPVCLKVMQTQINLALSNKGKMKALGYFTDAVANKETKAKLAALQAELAKEKDAEKRRVKMSEVEELSMQTFNGADEKKELSKEQVELLVKASFTTAGTWYFLGQAYKDAAELPELIKEGIDEVKDGIDNAKSQGMKGMKAVAGLTANLKGIQGAVKLVPDLLDATKAQKELFKKIGSMLKSNKYEQPSIEEASKSDSAWSPDDDDDDDDE